LVAGSAAADRLRGGVAVAQEAHLSDLHSFDGGESGFYTKTHFYDTGDEVVAFDAQFTPEAAAESLRYLAEQTDSPLRTLVLTHPSPDKFNGAPVFKAAGAKVLASAATADAIHGVHEYKKAFFVDSGMFTEESYPARAEVDETFSGEHVIRFDGGKTVELIELNRPGVSSTQTVAFIPELNALIVGDLVHHEMHAWLEGGIVDGQATATLDGWIANLDELATRFGEENPTVYGGRGEAALLSEAIPAQIAYLERADQIVSEYIATLGDQAAELSGPNAGKHHAAIQAQMVEAFPDHAFPDLIGFSVYGLVNAKT
jgi:glyoxylase-like metal-dependent hydrolase (beta-lactamase superfamily II)